MKKEEGRRDEMHKNIRQAIQARNFSEDETEEEGWMEGVGCLVCGLEF